MTEQFPTPKSFEEQFKETHPVETFGSEATYVDIRPEISSSEVPIIVASGWSEGRKSMIEVGEELYDSGRRVLLIDHARRGQTEELSEEEFGEETLQRANTLIEALEESGIERADVIAHSEGALDAVVAALSYPEKFRTLILTMPAGMIGKDSVLRLAGRFAPKILRSATKDTIENPNVGTAINIGGIKYIARNPAKAVREVREIANTTIHDVLIKLREKGIRVGIIQSNADTVFPADRIGQHVDLSDESANVDAYASINREDAGHDELLINPKTVVPAATQMIDQFYN